MNVIASSSNHHQNRQSKSALQTVLPLDLVNQFPNLMNNCRQSLAPFQSRVDGTNLFQGILFRLQKLAERKPGAGSGISMIGNIRRTRESHNAAGMSPSPGRSYASCCHLAQPDFPQRPQPGPGLTQSCSHSLSRQGARKRHSLLGLQRGVLPILAHAGRLVILYSGEICST